jgi:DNA-binding winged helix-turn-helix (wHTH) protein
MSLIRDNVSYPMQTSALPGFLLCQLSGTRPYLRRLETSTGHEPTGGSVNVSRAAVVEEIYAVSEEIAPHAAEGLVPIVTFVAKADDVNGALRELASKIQALLEEQTSPSGSVFDLGELRVDLEAHTVTVRGEEVFLTALEFKLLATLVTRRDRVQTRSKLLGDVWACSGLNKTRTVDTHIKRLRDKLGPAGRFIHTIRGSGYRLSERGPGGARRQGHESDPVRVSASIGRSTPDQRGFDMESGGLS